MSELCPGCSRPNQCAITLGKPADQCWCMTSSVVDKSRGRQPEVVLPLPETPSSCYCENCLAEIKNEAIFKKKLSQKN